MKKTRLVITALMVASMAGIALVALPAAQAATVAPSSGLTDQTSSGTCTQGYPYVVQQGDDLASIAQMFGTTVSNLVAFNGLTDPSLIDTGQTICIDDGTYIVQPGDDLVKIAGSFGVTLAALEQANNIVNPNTLFAGQVLVIPGSGIPNHIPVPFNRTYIVQRGDTVDTIAAKFDITPQSLIEINGLTDPSLIDTGQVLVIPDQYEPDVYTVQQGDTLSGIAAQYGTTVGILAEANQIPNVSLIHPGENIIVPETTETTTESSQ